MIELRANTSEGVEIINVPQSWDDVSYRAYSKLLMRLANCDESIAPVVTITTLCNIDEDLFIQLPADIVLQIATLTRFASELPSDAVPDEYKTFDIGDISWGKLVAVETAIKQIMDKYAGLDDNEAEPMRSCELFTVGEVMAREFLGEEIADKPVSEWAWVSSFFLRRLASLKTSFQNYSELMTQALIQAS